MKKTTNWSKYKHQTVRDLAWMLYSPPLFSKTIDNIPSLDLKIDECRAHNWLHSLEKTMGEYPKLERACFSRLGLYCEALLEFCFVAGQKAGVTPLRLLGRNIQINGKHATLGECDFIVKDENEKSIHIELAVKFYLQSPRSNSNWHQWIGPTATDRLDLKMKRMFSHQLKLLTARENQAFIKPVLNTMGIRTPREFRYLVKGCLFFHFDPHRHELDNNLPPPGPIPTGAHRSLEYGFWQHLKDFKNFYPLTKSNKSAIVCKKLDWLTGPNQDSGMMNKAELLEYIENEHRVALESKKTIPPIFLLIKYDECKLNTCPFIIVPNHWPGTSAPSRII